jgi:hypothetical protein
MYCRNDVWCRSECMNVRRLPKRQMDVPTTNIQCQYQVPIVCSKPYNTPVIILPDLHPTTKLILLQCIDPDQCPIAINHFVHSIPIQKDWSDQSGSHYDIVLPTDVKRRRHWFAFWGSSILFDDLSQDFPRKRRFKPLINVFLLQKNEYT